jgi:CheY-like chemotaxis protein
MLGPKVPLKILVVEDDLLVSRSLALILKRAGYLTDVVADAKHALLLFEPGKFDLVITDYEMPGMKGDELASIIKSQAPAQPVIILTGYLERLERDEKPIVADAVLGKPFPMAELLDTITKTLPRVGL